MFTSTLLLSTFIIKHKIVLKIIATTNKDSIGIVGGELLKN